MEDCIARGGISHVLAQARASLKHPSRPFTPKTGSRPLFHGDDYRPSSRPSSTYSQNGIEYDKPQSPQLTSSASTHTVTGRTRRQGDVHHVKDDVESDEDADESKTAATMYGPTSPLCDSARSKHDDDHEDGVKTHGDECKGGGDDDDDASVDPACYATPESLHMTLLQLQSALEDVQTSDASASTVQVVTKYTTQLFHDVHLLRHHDDDATAFSSGPVATAFDVCVTKLLAHVDVAPQAHVIGLVHAGLQLWACHLARITTHESQSGRLLVAACKRLFMQSKDPANDERFCHVTVVETLLGVLSSQCAHSVPTQALIYVAGVLKNVSGSARMVTLLSTNGAIAVFSKALQVTFDKDVNAAAQVLVQVTAILRNLAEHKQCLKQFWHAHVIQALCDLLPAYASHGELVLNVSRILSKLTLHEAGRTQVNKGKHNLRHLLKLLDGDTRSRQQDAALVIRLAFILGNLTATNDRNRKAIVTLGAVPPLVRMLKEYHIRYVHESPDNDTSATTAEDVLVKLVRLLANAAIHTSVGPMLGTVPGIEVLLDVLDHAKVARHEELMLNVVSCLTNLSFYSTDATPTNVITVHRHRLSRDLASILVDPNDEAVVEAARAFGNLSRFPDVLGAMLDPDSTALLPTFVMLLDHANRDVVYTVCGVLMNAALDQRTRGNLHAVPTTHDVVDTRDLLVRLFRHAGLKDLAMSTILCKVLFNLILSTAPSDTAATYVDTSTGRLLLTTLEELVDAMADSATEAEVEFASVAHALMRSLVK